MQGLKVGHFTDALARTGVSVFLFSPYSVGSYFVAGGSPATHELLPLDADQHIKVVHGLTLAGGSAFGLFAAEGVMRFLKEKNIGLSLPNGLVPIVPAAAIYDLGNGTSSAPSPEQAYQACLDAGSDLGPSGQVGAGTGASVGKIVPNTYPMTGGLGHASLSAGEVEVVAYAVVNAVGDIRNTQQSIVAGACYPDGRFANCEQYLLAGGKEVQFSARENTTLVAVFTNAMLNKGQLKRVARMSSAGMANVISPVFSCYDGDIVFAFSLGTVESSPLTVGVLAAKAVALAILDAVKGSRLL